MTSRARLAGYRAALESRGISVVPDLVCSGDFHHESGYIQTCALLELPEPPTAIFATSDLEATGVYQALYEKGLNVPKDISVIGFDDVPTSEWMSPPLTTICQPLKEMVRMAPRMLLSMIEGEILESKRVELKTSLVIRGSCSSQSHLE